MATLQAIPAVGGQPESPMEANETKVSRSSQWKGVNKPLSTPGVTVLNRRSRSRHIYGDRRLRGKKFLTSFYASTLQVAGVFLVLMLIHHCVRRYTHCLRTLSRETVGGVRQGSAPGGASSHIPRRLAVYTGELDDISTLGTEDAANDYSAVCRRGVGDTLAHLLPNEESSDSRGATQEAVPARDSSRCCGAKDLKASVQIGKGILQAALSLTWLATMVYVFSADDLAAPAHTGGSSGAASSSSTAATPQPGQGGCTVPPGLKTLLALLAVVNLVNEVVSMYLLHLESSKERPSPKSAKSNDAFVDDADDDVEKFLASKGQSPRRKAAGLPSWEEEVDDVLGYPDEGPKAPPPESPAEGSTPRDQPYT